MSCDESALDAAVDAANASVVQAVAGPRSASSDGQSVESHPLPDLIAAEKYLASKRAACNPARGLRFTRLVPPGSA